MQAKIFICYAHEDELLLNKLKKQLRPLQRQGLIEVWHDRDISAGTEWEQEINEHLNAAHIILLLVSPDFVDSDYCYSIEMKRAIERHERREARVIPIILRPIYWQGAPFGKLQALPADAKPITGAGLRNLDKVFFAVAEGIRKQIEAFFSQSPEEWQREVLSTDRISSATAKMLVSQEIKRQGDRGRIAAPEHEKHYPYDVALSYAGEDQKYAEELADTLKQRGVKVFYDKYEKSTLWGQNLYTYLSDLYQNRAYYCILFLSRHYAAKLWTSREREAAQARALREQEAYILPIRLDDTEIPNFSSSIAYLDLRQETIESIANIFLQKLAEKTSSRKELFLGGEGKEITVISADIYSFTFLSDSLKPEEVMNLLNGYLEIMNEIIREEEGTVTTLTGNSLLAIFNAPVSQHDHALKAVRTTWRMREAILEYQRLRPQYMPISFGFAVNTGQALVGNIGSEKRILNYTAIGDAINIASRLQSIAADNTILVSNSTFLQVRQYVQVENLGPLNVKNRREPLSVWLLKGLL